MKEKAEAGGKKKSLAGMACQNIPRKPSGKMTQAALALSGTVVLARAHNKLESIFPWWMCWKEGTEGWEQATARGRTGNGEGGE